MFQNAQYRHFKKTNFEILFVLRNTVYKRSMHYSNRSQNSLERQGKELVTMISG